MCDYIQACFELVPSQKFQYQDAGFPPLLVSLNSTVRGTFPDPDVIMGLMLIYVLRRE